MLVTVIHPFPFSRDGRTTEHAVASSEPQDIPDALVPGLVAEGYIEQPESLPPFPFSAGRRRVMVDRITELFRAHMEALSDEQLTETLASAERHTAEAAERQTAYATKIAEPLEHGDPNLFNGADPAAFDHDGDSKPGGSLKLDGLAAIADVNLDLVQVADGELLTGEGVAAPLGVITGDGTGEALPPVEANAGEQTAPATFDLDTADEDALRAFLTARDGKEPDKRFGPDRLRALAKTAPAAEGASE